MTPARNHLVWDWNGTLLDDLQLMVDATNAAFASVGGPRISADQHRTLFRRPIIDYYTEVLGRSIDDEAFARCDRIFHDAYRDGLTVCGLAADATTAMRSWQGTPVTALHVVPRRAGADRADLRPERPLPPRRRAARHRRRRAEGRSPGPAPDRAGRCRGSSVVLIGDSIDDALAADAVGARCVLYAGGVTHPDRLRDSGWPVADSLTEAVRLAATLD